MLLARVGRRSGRWSPAAASWSGHPPAGLPPSIPLAAAYGGGESDGLAALVLSPLPGRRPPGSPRAWTAATTRSLPRASSCESALRRGFRGAVEGGRRGREGLRREGMCRRRDRSGRGDVWSRVGNCGSLGFSSSVGLLNAISVRVVDSAAQLV
jgi:hypothetical protein